MTPLLSVARAVTAATLQGLQLWAVVVGVAVVEMTTGLGLRLLPRTSSRHPEVPLVARTAQDSNREALVGAVEATNRPPPLSVQGGSHPGSGYGDESPALQ